MEQHFKDTIIKIKKTEKENFTGPMETLILESLGTTNGKEKV